MRQWTRQTTTLSVLLATMMLPVVLPTVVQAQDAGAGTTAATGTVRITSPQTNQDVRGEITVRYEGIPEGGYAIIKVDGQFKQATADNSYVLNTFPPTFPGDGPHRVSVTAINAGGKRAGEAQVTFNVANTKVDEAQAALPLVHWVPTDRIGLPVERYRIYAESNAIIEDSTTGGGGSGGSGGSGGGSGGGGGEGADSGFMPAPLDWQVSALVRRYVRDVDMVDGAANIRTVVQEALQRQRYGEGKTGQGGEGGHTKKRKRRREEA